MPGELFLSTVTGDSRITRLTGADALPATYASAGRPRGWRSF
jgi:hypothetical protein